MWSSERRRLLAGLAGLLALGACGFRPLYAEGGPAARLSNRVEIGTITRGTLPDRMTFTLRDELRRRFGRDPADPAYRLDIALTVEELGLAITPDNETTRYNLTGRAAWSLVPRGAAEPALAGIAESYTAYSATATVYATRIAARDAERRLATALADRIATQIAARAGQLPA
ncbi:MAG TPA: LPS assembly lipoprotein LptE [Paracoccaceae bacterium]|nr:LPS assembly lipoprotein LptE [Paracoccaceae bacterium]